MSRERCPREDELIRFVDRDLTPEQLERIAQHVTACALCSHECDRLQQLIADLSAPVASAPLAVEEHVAAVMSRVDAPGLQVRRPRAKLWLAGALLAAAAVALLVQWRGAARERDRSALEQVAVLLYDRPFTAPLEAGATISARGRVAVRATNGSQREVHVAVFALDATQRWRWLAPTLRRAVTKSGDAPVGAGTAVQTSLTRSPWQGTLEQLMPDLRRKVVSAPTVAPSPEPQVLTLPTGLGELRPGPLRVFSLISARPLLVAEVELAVGGTASAAALQRRFPDALVRELPLALEP